MISLVTAFVVSTIIARIEHVRMQHMMYRHYRYTPIGPDAHADLSKLPIKTWKYD